MKIGLQSRLLASLVLLVLVTLAILGEVLLVDSKKKLEAFQLTQAQYQARTLVEGSLDALISKDFEQLERLVASALPSSVFAYAALVRTNGQVLTHSDMDFIGTNIATPDISLTATIHEISYKSRPVREVIYPAIVGINHIANAHVAYYLDAPTLGAYESLAWIVFAVVLSIVILSIGSYFITRRVIRPIEQLTEIASSLSFDQLENDLSGDDSIAKKLHEFSNRRDEIGLLYKMFDNAMSRLRLSYLDLHESKAILLKKTDALVVAKAQAEQASVAKSAFLANMSHEIRTPLTAIIGFSEILLDEEISKQEHLSSTHTIIRSGKHLLGIISDILDFSKIEADKLEVESVRFNLFQMMAEINSLAHIQAKVKGIQFEILYKYPLPETIESDMVRVKQIIINLCNNAIKFTEKGMVTVEVSCNKDKTEISFSVIDTGIGMSVEQKNIIFDAFTQADISTTRKYGGTGLGLHLSKRLAEFLGGNIYVQSIPGVGSQFNLVVPSGALSNINFLTKPPMDILEPNVTVKHPSDKLLGHVLLVEDNKANQTLICRYIEKTGAEVTVAENGKIAIEKVLAQSFNLILMDIQMPVMGGLQAIQILRSQGYAGSIVALTANSMAHDIEGYLEVGFDAFLAKPIEKEKFFQLLRDQLKPNTDNCRAAIPILSSLLDEDCDLADLDMVETYVNDLPSVISDIENAAKHQQIDNLRSKLHDLKATGGGYGYSVLTEISKHISQELKQDNYQSVLSLIQSLRHNTNLIQLGFKLSQKNHAIRHKTTSFAQHAAPNDSNTPGIALHVKN